MESATYARARAQTTPRDETGSRTVESGQANVRRGLRPRERQGRPRARHHYTSPNTSPPLTNRSITQTATAPGGAGARGGGHRIPHPERPATDTHHQPANAPQIPTTNRPGPPYGEARPQGTCPPTPASLMLRSPAWPTMSNGLPHGASAMRQPTHGTQVAGDLLRRRPPSRPGPTQRSRLLRRHCSCPATTTRTFPHRRPTSRPEPHPNQGQRPTNPPKTTAKPPLPPTNPPNLAGPIAASDLGFVPAVVWLPAGLLGPFPGVPAASRRAADASGVVLLAKVGPLRSGLCRSGPSGRCATGSPPGLSSYRHPGAVKAGRFFRLGGVGLGVWAGAETTCSRALRSPCSRAWGLDIERVSCWPLPGTGGPSVSLPSQG